MTQSLCPIPLHPKSAAMNSSTSRRQPRQPWPLCVMSAFMALVLFLHHGTAEELTFRTTNTSYVMARLTYKATTSAANNGYYLQNARRSLWATAGKAGGRVGPGHSEPFNISFLPFLSNGFFIRVSLGLPPKPFDLLIDTGFPILFTYCSTCPQCPAPANDLYNPQNSVSSLPFVCSKEKVYCAEAQTYGDIQGCAGPLQRECPFNIQFDVGSRGVSGVMFRDQLAVPGLPRVPFAFGCLRGLDGPFLSRGLQDGIAGMSPQALSLNSQLAHRLELSNVFTLCLGIPGGNGTDGGYMIIGDHNGSDGKRETSVSDTADGSSYPMTFVRMSKLQLLGYYGVPLVAIAINNREIPIRKRGFRTRFPLGLGTMYNTIFDTGSSLTTLSRPVHDGVVSAIYSVVAATMKNATAWGKEESLATFGFRYCWRNLKLIETVSQHFPTLELRFRGSSRARMLWGPEGYLAGIPEVDSFCVAIAGATVKSGAGIQYIGSNILRGHEVVYDNKNKRIGWRKSKSSCL